MKTKMKLNRIKDFRDEMGQSLAKGGVMNRASMTIGLLLGVAILLCGLTNQAHAADSVSVTRSDGTLDAFAVTPCQYGECALTSVVLRHTAIGNYGTGTVYSNDMVFYLPSSAGINLINAYWINSNQNGPHMELHVRFYMGKSVDECVWGYGNAPGWSGPFDLK